MNKDQIIEAIKEMSVLELNELVQACEEEFGVSAAAGVVVAAAGEGGAAAEEQTEFTVVLEAAGSQDSFRMAWQYARPNAVVTVVALYDEPQILPLPEMYGKNLIFKTGGVDGCNCAETLRLIENGKIDTTPLITHTYPLGKIAAAYELFENRRDGVIKVAIQTALS